MADRLQDDTAVMLYTDHRAAKPRIAMQDDQPTPGLDLRIGICLLHPRDGIGG
jgi:hypothetical protein